MQTRLLVTAESGLVVWRDFDTKNPVSDGREDTARRVLRSEAENGRWFLIDADDTVTYRFNLHVDEEPVALPGHRFQRLGGTFGLDLASGRLGVSGFEDWSSERDPEPISVDPGSYSLTIFGSGEFEKEAYDEEMRELLGDDDWRYRQRIDRLGLAGCLSTLVAAVLVLLPFTRGFWPFALGVLALGWLPFLALQKMSRYRAIDQRISEYEKELPHFVVHLEMTGPDRLLPGGHIHA